MKRILFALLALSSLALTLAALNTGSAANGVFHASADRVATVRFEFKLAQNVLLNLAGSSEIAFLNPFTGKEVALEVSKGEPYPSAPKDYLQRLEPVAFKLEIPKNAKTGVYNVKLTAQMFLCEGVLKVCYVEQTPGNFEIRVGQNGPDTPVKLEYLRPQR